MSTARQAERENHGGLSIDLPTWVQPDSKDAPPRNFVGDYRRLTRPWGER